MHSNEEWIWIPREKRDRLGQWLVHLLVLVESNPDVDPVHRLPEEERPEGHREVGRHPHHLLPLLRSLWLAASPLRLSAADWGILATAAASSGHQGGSPPSERQGFLLGWEEWFGLALLSLLGLNHLSSDSVCRWQHLVMTEALRDKQLRMKLLQTCLPEIQEFVKNKGILINRNFVSSNCD